MTENSSEQAEPDEQATTGPAHEDLPGNRTDGPDDDPLDAAEAEGGEVGAG